MTHHYTSVVGSLQRSSEFKGSMKLECCYGKNQLRRMLSEDENDKKVRGYKCINAQYGLLLVPNTVLIIQNKVLIVSVFFSQYFNTRLPHLTMTVEYFVVSAPLPNSNPFLFQFPSHSLLYSYFTNINTHTRKLSHA